MIILSGPELSYILKEWIEKINIKKSRYRVYCKNCKYISEGTIYCNHPRFLVLKRPSYFEEKYSWSVSDSINASGFCEYYKRKWYKFWVK
jgi:hypothetical protein